MKEVLKKKSGKYIYTCCQCDHEWLSKQVEYICPQCKSFILEEQSV
jgi:Zn finger protein HypA/HybF involved in hydrogenase expression